MSSAPRLFQILNKRSDKIDNDLLEDILEVNAINRDLLINNDILKQLVCDYAILEKKYFEQSLQLQNKQAQLEEDLEAASKIQKSLLPKEVPSIKNFCFDWTYLPCEQMGGDLVNIIPAGQDKWILYIVDVSGHGPKAAMITVALSQFLNSSLGSKSQVDFLRPSSVMQALEAEFPFSRFDSFFTIIYGVLDINSGDFVFCNSAHPFPLLVDENGAEYIEQHDAMLGLGLCSEWSEIRLSLTGNKKLFFYTDGLVECVNDKNEQFGEERLQKLVAKSKTIHGTVFNKLVHEDIISFCNGISLKDDFTCLLIESQF